MINYIKGDATKPVGAGHKIIVHICNDIGRWGKGFVLAISKRWIKPEQEYREWYKESAISGGMKLGTIQCIQVEDDITVINMIAQKGLKTVNGIPPIRYPSLNECLDKVSAYAREVPSDPVTIHMPRIGCGLAGGKWSEIEPMVENTLKNFDVFVYDL